MRRKRKTRLSETAAENTSAADPAPWQAALDRRIDRWKKELLDTGKRNRMIHYRETKRTTLRILEPGDKELFNQLAVSEKTLSFQRPISKDSDFRTYSMLALLETLSYSLPVHVGDIRAEGTVMEREKTLKNLRSRTKLAQEEQGTNILYLSFGFILWKQSSRESAQWLKSPLLMMPVQLGLKSLNAPYTLSKYDDEIEVNPTLDYLFNQDYGIDLPAFELKNRDSYEDYLEQIEEIIDKKGWKLVREVSLGLLSFLKISMYHDLNNHREQMLKSPVIQAIAGNRHAVGDIPAAAMHFKFDETDPSEWHEVVDADSSQEEAILLSRLGVSFVMQGPPGTGKSQTITNIIAEALADGRKVLFVSEKSAALQVVLKRLTEAGLSDFCLSLHNYKANKKEIIDNIGANLRLDQEYPDSSAPGELAELFHDRKYLDAYADDLHRAIEPLGESVYGAFGKLSDLSEASALEFELDNPTQISGEEYSSLLYAVEAFEQALHNLGGKLSDNPWAETTAAFSGQTFQTEMTNATDGLSGQLKDIESSVSSLNGEFGTAIGHTWEEAAQGARSMQGVLDLPLFPYTWRDREKREFLRKKALREEQIDKDERDHAVALSALMRKIAEDWKTEGLGFHTRQLTEIFPDEAIWRKEAEKRTLISGLEETVAALEELESAAKELCAHYEQAADLLRFRQEDTPSAVLRMSGILRALSDAPAMDAGWFDVRKNPEYRALLAEVQNHRDIVQQKSAQLLMDWEPAVLELDAAGMLARFKTEYTSVFHRFKESYREDIRRIKLLSRAVGARLSRKDVIALLRQVEDLHQEQKWFSDHEGLLSGAFPNHYRGRETDWDQIAAGVGIAAEIAGSFPYADIPEDVIAAIRETTGSIRLSAKVRRLADLLAGESVNAVLEQLVEAGLLAEVLEEKSLREEVLPETEDKLAKAQSGRALIDEIDSAHRGGAVTFSDFRALQEAAEGLRRECRWFKEHIPELASELNIPEADEETPVRKALETSGRILKNHDAIAEKDETEELTGYFGDRYTGNDTDWQAVIRDLDAVGAFEGSGAAEGMDGFIMAVCGDAGRRGQAGKTVGRLASVLHAAEPGLTYFEALFPKSDMRHMALPDIGTKYAACMSGFGALDRWLDYVEARAECDRRGLAGFTAGIAERDNEIRDVRAAFERGFYTQWLSLAMDGVPAVQTFRRRVHEQRLEKFRRLDEKQFEIARSRIRERIIGSFPDRNAAAGARSELRTLQHEMEKKRRIMPLRKLFHEIPGLLLTLKPCLMMSPLSVAYFLNAEDYHFDLVIFDEASQIFPQDAIGAIFRADQVIIAGDTRQLPPTSFFSASTSNANEDFDENDDDFEEEVYESILEEAASVLPGRTLLWHYRSRHEQLIAFSNQEIYRNELVTFPSSNESEPDSGVEFVYVEDGYYEEGGRNRNLPEAKRIAELVKDHIDRHPDRSLGIIAFSEKQQQAISQEIQRFREKNAGYEEFFQEGKEDEFFVKNLENVQGDERDTIFFSVGYARTREQKAAGKPMAMRFGPLGVSGGERRLNVAITRARINVKLVSSIMPSDIDPGRTASDGIRMLRSYMEFACHGGAALTSAGQSRKPDEFADAVYRYLCERGYRARQYVGCSGYRIDIAVEHPALKDQFAAGIECDGLSYASARTARDRDRLRGAVLKSRGWELYRVWSAEWYRNPELEAEKLVTFIERAIENSNQRLRGRKAMEETEVKNIEVKATEAEEKEVQEKGISESK